jgi:lipopolysaccharide export system protein LptA
MTKWAWLREFGLTGSICLAITMASSGEATSQTVDTVAIAGAVKGQQNVDVEADSMEVVEAEKKAVFTGNVSAVRTGTRLNSDLMVVNYAEMVQADGSKRTDVTIIDAKGNVQITTARQVITGDRAILDVAGNLLTVTGNVMVKEGDTIVRGTKLTADLKAKTSSMTGGRVKGSFVPKSSSN